MNLDHEYNKARTSYDNNIITEDQFHYECFKLTCIAEKHNSNWQCPIVPNTSNITQQTINEDYSELESLYKNKLLKKQLYTRDSKKILALCENLGMEFPGPQTIRENINIKHIASIINEDDSLDDGLYDELSDEDEYEDDEYEDQEPILYRSLQLDNGWRLEDWYINSEAETCAVNVKDQDNRIYDYDTIINIILQNIPDSWKDLIMKIGESYYEIDNTGDCSSYEQCLQAFKEDLIESHDLDMLPWDDE